MRKALLNLTMEQTVKLVGVIAITVFIFVLAGWGLGHARTLGDYLSFSPSGGDVTLVDYEVDGVFTATVEFSNTEEEEREMWLEMEGFNPSGLFGGGPSRYDMDRHPSGNDRVTMQPGETSGEVELSGSHHDAGCEVEVRLMGDCGGRWLCGQGAKLDTVTVRLYETGEVHSEWEGECQ